MPAVSTSDRRPETTIALLRRQAEEAPRDIATFHRLPSGTWSPTTWLALWEEVRRTAAALQQLGLRPGDRLAILARTRREWQIAELGANSAGASVVGIDAHAAPEQIAWILEHANVSGIVVDGSSSLAKIPVNLQNDLRFVLVLDEEPQEGNRVRWFGWRSILTAQGIPPLGAVSTPGPDTPVMRIYTSGTTGEPKGIEYTHRDLMTACWAMLDEFGGFERSRAVCWLPMSALFQRMMNLLAIASRSVTYFVEDPRDIMARLPEIRPTVFMSVPRFYEKLHDGIQAQLAAQPRGKQLLTQAAIAVGAQWSQSVRNGPSPGLVLRIRHAVLDWLVLRRIRAVMGGEVKWMISGSAAAPIWLLEFFHSIGFLVLEAYGITENPVPIAVNRPYMYRFGSVGKPFSANAVRLAEDGEVLVKGSALFREYVGEGFPLDRLTSDDYYRTGDYGRFDSDGFLYLTGRIKEIIKTSTGRRLSPAAIEGVYRQSRYVDQIVIVGNDRPHLAALIALNAPAVESSLAPLGRSNRSGEELRTSPDVIDLVDKDLSRLGERLARHERVRAFAILASPLSIESGELTASLKLRRDRIEARHADTIERMYSDGQRQVLGQAVQTGGS